jgi:hypothetical protein
MEDQFTVYQLKGEDDRETYEKDTTDYTFIKVRDTNVRSKNWHREYGSWMFHDSESTKIINVIQKANKCVDFF